MKARLMKINRIYWIAGAVILLAIIGLIIWNVSSAGSSRSSLTQTYTVTRGTLTQSVGGTGSVRASQTAVLTWQTTGTVGAVNVQIGDQVKTDAVLATLLQSSLPQTVVQAAADLVTAQTALDQATVSETGKATAEQAVVTAQQALQTAQNKLDSMGYPRASDAIVQNALAKIELQQRQVATAADTWRIVQNRLDKNPQKAQALYNLTNAQVTLDNLIANYNWYTGKATALDLAQAQAARDLAKSQLADAQRTLDTYSNGSVPADVASAQAKVAIAQATLNEAEITAPFAGVVTEADSSVGDVIAAGTTAFRLDNIAHLLVDVNVSEVDINQIKANMPVTMQFDAIPNKTYHGKVVKVNLAGEVASNAVTFTITTELTDADALVKPGMSANVTVIVKQVTNALLVPNTAVRTFNGRSLVTLMQNGQPTPTQVTVGVVSDTVSQIVSGLNEGDTIELPTASGTTTGGFGGGGFRGGGGGVRVP